MLLINEALYFHSSNYAKKSDFYKNRSYVLIALKYRNTYIDKNNIYLIL